MSAPPIRSRTSTAELLPVCPYAPTIQKRGFPEEDFWPASLRVLFCSGRNAVGWLLMIAGALFIPAGVIANMHIYCQPTSLLNTLVMLILFVSRLGLTARSAGRIAGRTSCDCNCVGILLQLD